MNRLLLGQVAALIVAVATVPYIVSILRGHTKPSVGSYAIKSVIAVAALASYVAAGAISTAWTMCALSLSAVLIFGLSLRYGIGGFHRFDLGCLLAAVAGLLLWWRTGDPRLALFIVVGIRIVSGLPLLQKLARYPRTESMSSWSITLSGELLNIAALTSVALSISLLPITEAASTGVIVALILWQRRTGRTCTVPSVPAKAPVGAVAPAGRFAQAGAWSSAVNDLRRHGDSGRRVAALAAVQTRPSASWRTALAVAGNDRTYPL